MSSWLQKLSDLVTLAAAHPPFRFGRREAYLASVISPMTTVGDTTYMDSTSAAARLAGNTSATKKFMTQTGNGTVSAAPAWSTLASADVPLPGHGCVLVLNSVTAASNAVTVNIPANFLQTGDVIEIRGGFTTDGSSNAVTLTTTIGGDTVASSGSDSNTGAHKWTSQASIYYDGTNAVTLDSTIASTATTVRDAGTSQAITTTALVPVTMTASTAHATPVGISVRVYRA